MEALLSILKLVASNLLVYLAFAVGLVLAPGELRAALRRHVLWRGLAVAFVGVPALTMLALWLVPVPPIVATVVMLSAVSPGVFILAQQVRKQRGDLPLAVAFSHLATLGAIALLPLSLRLVAPLAGGRVDASPATLFLRIGLPVVAATALGLAVRRWAPRAAAAIAPWAMGLFKVVLGLVLVALVARVVPVLLDAAPATILMALMVTLASALLGHAVAGPDERDRRTIAIAATFGNPALALAIAATAFPRASVMPVLAGYLVVRSLATLGYVLVEKRLAARRTRRARATLRGSSSGS